MFILKLASEAIKPRRIYKLQLKVKDKTFETTGEIKEVPLYETAPGQYEAFDALMIDMETKVTEMHQMVNTLYKAQQQLDNIVATLPEGDLKQKGAALLQDLTSWDSDMVQRKSQAYDDVENFPNKFTAEYLFLVNQTNSEIQRVNKASKVRKAELDTQWQSLKARGNELLDKQLPNYNRALWEAGIGAVRW